MLILCLMFDFEFCKMAACVCVFGYLALSIDIWILRFSGGSTRVVHDSGMETIEFSFVLCLARYCVSFILRVEV